MRLLKMSFIRSRSVEHSPGTEILHLPRPPVLGPGIVLPKSKEHPDPDPHCATEHPGRNTTTIRSTSVHPSLPMRAVPVPKLLTNFDATLLVAYANARDLTLERVLDGGRPR